jgi:hypothetical protein
MGLSLQNPHHGQKGHLAKKASPREKSWFRTGPGTLRKRILHQTGHAHGKKAARKGP